MNRLVFLAVIVALAACGVAAFEKDSFEIEGGAPRKFPELDAELVRFKAKSEESSEESSEASKSEESSEESSNVEKLHEDLVRNMHLVSTTEDGDKDKELEEALQSIKDQIVAKANQIKSEKAWVKEVTKIIETYVKKTRRVNANIRTLQKDVKVLFRKKKQVENMIMQRKLEQKLRIANDDLSTLQGAMSGLQKKAVAFVKNKSDIQNTIGAIESELAKLRGSKKPAQE